LLFFSSVALIAIVKPENRYVIVPLAILSAFAARSAATFQGKSRWFLIAAAVAGIFGWQFSRTLSGYQPGADYTWFGCAR
jgi:hypothetical protein